MHKKLNEKFLIAVHHPLLQPQSLPLSLTLTDVPQWIEMVAKVTVTDVAIQAVFTLSMTTNAPA